VRSSRDDTNERRVAKEIMSHQPAPIAPLTIHDQGSLTASLRAIIQRIRSFVRRYSFPSAREAIDWKTSRVFYSSEHQRHSSTSWMYALRLFPARGAEKYTRSTRAIARGRLSTRTREDRSCIAHRSCMQCECRPARTTLTLINAESLICMHGNDFCREGAPARISLIIAQVLIAGATGVSISREAEHARREDPREDSRATAPIGTDRDQPITRATVIDANRRGVKGHRVRIRRAILCRRAGAIHRLDFGASRFVIAIAIGRSINRPIARPDQRKDFNWWKLIGDAWLLKHAVSPRHYIAARFVTVIAMHSINLR